MEDEDKEQEYNWSEYGDLEGQNQVKLEGKDVIAISIAAIQTIFLPLFILVVFLVAISIIVGILF